ncbi:MAG TPA: hypothetical protein VFG62_25955 [Rhodopila sp.]|jgi:hypothetical protein|nr:hypothetical protein [Rhodopila sp.]
MNDMSRVIIPKSDQMNADDLISGPRTITITEVSIKPGTEQPVSIFFDGDEGKPYKACKSMCRVMVTAWGPDANQYVGRSMTLYRDPSVKWGGMAIGGIRISHMSDIERDLAMTLTATKGKWAPYKVKPLQAQKPAATQPSAPATDRVLDGVNALIARIAAAVDLDTFAGIMGDADVRKRREWLKTNRPELSEQLEVAINVATEALAKPIDNDEPGDTGDDGWPGPDTAAAAP